MFRLKRKIIMPFRLAGTVFLHLLIETKLNFYEYMREWVKYIRASVTTPSVYDKVYVFTQTRHLHGSDWQLEF